MEIEHVSQFICCCCYFMLLLFRLAQARAQAICSILATYHLCA